MYIINMYAFTVTGCVLRNKWWLYALCCAAKPCYVDSPGLIVIIHYVFIM